MRKVILQEFVSADGFGADADGSVDFISAATDGDQSLGDRQLDFIDSIDTMLLGRRTYEMFVDYWPNVTEGEDARLAEKLNNLEKVVVSRTLAEAPWGRFSAGRIVKSTADVAALKRAPGEDIVVWGSLSLARSLRDENLIDEYQLIVCPIVLGAGAQLFREPRNLTLIETRSFDRGAVLLTYRPA